MPLAPKPSCRQTKIGNHCPITAPGASDASRDRRTQRVMEASSRPAKGKPPILMPVYLTALGLPCPIAGIPCRSTPLALPSRLHRCRGLPGTLFFGTGIGLDAVPSGWSSEGLLEWNWTVRRDECPRRKLHTRKWRVSSGSGQEVAMRAQDSQLAVSVCSPSDDGTEGTLVVCVCGSLDRRMEGTCQPCKTKKRSSIPGDLGLFLLLKQARRQEPQHVCQPNARIGRIPHCARF